jgi:hypothetical protein
MRTSSSQHSGVIEALHEKKGAKSAYLHKNRFQHSSKAVSRQGEPLYGEK